MSSTYTSLDCFDDQMNKVNTNKSQTALTISQCSTQTFLLLITDNVVIIKQNFLKGHLFTCNADNGSDDQLGLIK